MCGIYLGTKKYDGSMKHRGIKTNELKYRNLYFAHEHLPIQATIDDYSIIQTDRYIILFNGELFLDYYTNDLEYIKDIFINSADTYSAIDNIYKQDGFYSFIIYDNEYDLIYAFTDPLGKKQLYYDGNTIASELRPLEKQQLNNYHITRTIKYGYTIGDSTPYKNIKRIIPNKIYIFDKYLSLYKIHHYPIYNFKSLNNANLYSLIDKAVSNRLKGHKEVGLLLSGGLDSSIIYHHVKNHIKDINTYCINNKEDLEYAKLLDPNVIPIDITYKDEALEAMEMPLDLGSMYPQYDLFSKVKETVILTGDGSDEIFGGYRRMNIYDSQLSDIFDELPYYHNIRLDRMSMIHTKEVRSPFMSLDIVRYGLGLDYKERINKNHLRSKYKNILPDEIIYRKKEPLKTDIIRDTNEFKYRKELVDKWIKINSIK